MVAVNEKVMHCPDCDEKMALVRTYKGMPSQPHRFVCKCGKLVFHDA